MMCPSRISCRCWCRTANSSSEGPSLRLGVCSEGTSWTKATLADGGAGKGGGDNCVLVGGEAAADEAGDAALEGAWPLACRVKLIRLNNMTQIN